MFCSSISSGIRSCSPTNSQKRFNAQMADLEAKRGGVLIGPATTFLGWLANVVDALDGPNGTNEALENLRSQVRGTAEDMAEAAGPTETAPTELTDLLVVHLRDRELTKVARMRTRRQIVLEGGAEIVEDAVSVFDGRRVVKRFRELEVELLDGDKG